MLTVEARQMYRSNGLMDDFVVYGTPDDYIRFSEIVGTVASTKKPVIITTDSEVLIEVLHDEDMDLLFTSLQNLDNSYLSIKDWNERNILRVIGCEKVLAKLHLYLTDLSTRGKGYSYISEYSEEMEYSQASPEWRLHVESV